MFSVNYIFLLNITYVFAIITCLGFLVYSILNFIIFNCQFNLVYFYLVILKGLEIIEAEQWISLF